MTTEAASTALRDSRQPHSRISKRADCGWPPSSAWVRLAAASGFLGPCPAWLGVVSYSTWRDQLAALTVYAIAACDSLRLRHRNLLAVSQPWFRSGIWIWPVAYVPPCARRSQLRRSRPDRGRAGVGSICPHRGVRRALACRGASSLSPPSVAMAEEALCCIRPGFGPGTCCSPAACSGWPPGSGSSSLNAPAGWCATRRPESRRPGISSQIRAPNTLSLRICSGDKDSLVQLIVH